MSEKIYRNLVLVLLLVLVLGLGLNVYSNFTRAARCAAAATLFEGFFTEYQSAVYDNPKVTNINQQTFIAAEYQIQAQLLTAGLIAACAP